MSSDAESNARAAYDDPGADWFYSRIWGGEDIHIGVYEAPDESIAVASHRTLERMAAMVRQERIEHVVDLGSGYAGASRFLQRHFGAHALAVNLSAEQNARARALNEQAGLSEGVTVVEGSYTDVPAQDESFDLAWSQDAFLHSDRREVAIAEAARVLRPGGELLFTDPMGADGAAPEDLVHVLDRLRLPSLGSPGRYREYAEAVGLVEVGFADHSDQLTTHYRRVLEESEARLDELRRAADDAFLERMLGGLRNWVDAGERGLLAWGIFHFRKP